MRTAVNGSVCESITSLPFGDGQSTTGSCGDPSARHFTGKQRDTETNLDDFDARYYSSQYGRFISADWSAVPAPVPYANLTNPQTLNLYAMVSDNPETFADLDGHSYTAATAGGGMDLTGVGSGDFNSTGGDIPGPLALFQQQAQVAQQAAERAQQQKEVGAEVYAEKTNGTADEYKAMASVIVNRANSGEKQYVQKGEDVNIHNVVSDKQQLQAYGSTNYNNFYNGSPKVSKAARATVEGAVGDVFKNSATTKATFFIANQGGAAPIRAQIHALGSVVPASPATVGGVYLYVVKPPRPGP